MIGSRKPLGIDSAERIRPQMMQMGAMMQPPKIKKPFGSNGELGQLGALLLSASGNPAGQSLMQMQARREEAAREQQNYQRQLNDQWSMFERKQEYERANPTPAAPTTFQRDYEYILQTQGKPAADLFLQNKINPITGVPYQDENGSGIRFIRPGGMGGAEMPPEVLDEIPDEGGPSLTSSGGFRPGF